jgi:hypothetical protein
MTSRPGCINDQRAGVGADCCIYPCQGLVRIDFMAGVWVELEPEAARRLAAMLLANAEAVEQGRKDLSRLDS